MQTNVLIKEECILKNNNKSCPYKKLSVFYNSCLKTFGSHLVYPEALGTPLIALVRPAWAAVGLFFSPVATRGTTRFNMRKLCVLSAVYLCVLYGS